MAVGITICHVCEFRIPAGKYKCPSCGTWQNLDASSVSQDETILLKDATSSDDERIDVDYLNYCWGGGLTRTSVTLFGGMPGAGKSTILLQILKLVHLFTKKETMYIATEEAVKEIKSRANRLSIFDDGIRLCPAMTGVGNIGGLLAKWAPSAIVVDSLQGMTGGNDLQSIELLQTLKKFCVTLNAPGIVISHVNKEGDYAGLMTFQHAVDTLFLMTPEEDGTRVLEVQKNRFGRAFIESYFQMTESGLIYIGNGDESKESSASDESE